jgi:hypothetical protein
MKPTLKDKEEALDLIRYLLSFNFQDAITYKKYNDDEYAELMFEEWRDTHRSILNSLDIELERGASKVCILTPNKDWIIKVNIDRSAKKFNSGINYCKTEYDNYRSAIEEGFGDYFAVMDFCGIVDGIEVYLQERAELDEYSFESSMHKYVSSCYPEDQYPDEDKREELIESAMFDCDIEDYVTAFLGSDTDYLIEFLYEHEINDLHYGNWGYARDGRIIMIDYSGFFE